MSRATRWLLLVGLLPALLALIACSGQTGTTSGGTSSGNTITLQNIAFNPSSLTVSVGATVTFKNADTVEHHIVVGTDDLGVIQPGQSAMWKAPKAGVYVMKCLSHPSMQGQITVGAGGSTMGTLPTGGGTGGGY